MKTKSLLKILILSSFVLVLGCAKEDPAYLRQIKTIKWGAIRIQIPTIDELNGSQTTYNDPSPKDLLLQTEDKKILTEKMGLIKEKIESKLQGVSFVEKAQTKEQKESVNASEATGEFELVFIVKRTDKVFDGTYLKVQSVLQFKLIDNNGTVRFEKKWVGDSESEIREYTVSEAALLHKEHIKYPSQVTFKEPLGKLYRESLEDLKLKIEKQFI